MTVAMDLPFNLMSGMDYSLKVYERTREAENLLASRPFRMSLLSSLPITAAVAWIYGKTPDWMLSYYADHRKIPRAMQGALFLAYPAMYALGYLAAPQLEQLSEGLTRKVIGGILAYEALFAILGWRRFTHICTTEEFHSGESSISYWHPNHLRWALVGAMMAGRAALLRRELKRIENEA